MRRPGTFLKFASGVVSLSLVTLTLSSLGANAADARVIVAHASSLPATDSVVATPITTSFDVSLKQPNETALANFIASLSDVASADYHHFLTPRQFAQRFGATDATVTTVSSYFKKYGLRVDSLSTSHVLLRLSGSTTQIAQAFATPVETVRTSTGLSAQFTHSATLPQSIARDVKAVAGLSSVINPTSSLATSKVSHVSVASTCSSAGTSSTVPNALGGYPATAQAQLYGLTSAYASGNTGVGQTIAAYELGLYDSADLATYFSCYGLSTTVTPVNVDGGPTGGYNEEATIDVEEAAALAPGATIAVYQGPDSGSGPTDIYQKIASDDTATIVTTSWGICETDPSGDVTAEQAIFQEMAAQGQTVIAASGDSGSSDCSGNGDGFTPTSLSVDDPASQPLVTGVGGLSVTNTSPLVQTVWNGGPSGGAGGGGVSTLWSRPSWQIGSGISTAQTMRMVPDLSTMADPNTGFIEYYSGTSSGVVRCFRSCSSGWDSIGGTSIGSPIVSALVAVAAQACGTARLGFINPTLYQMSAQGIGFNDVTTGSNAIYSVAGYSAGVGYDMASGLGSPNATNFISGLCPPKISAAKSSFSVSTTTPSVGASATITLNLKNVDASAATNTVVSVNATEATGTIVLNGDTTTSTGAGQASTTLTTNATGAATLSVTTNTPGAVTVTIAYAGTTLHTTTLNFSATSARTVPGKPVIASLSALIGGFKLTVRPSTSGSSPIVSYQYSVNSGATWSTFSGATRTVSVSTLARSRTYAVIVRAHSAVGFSAPSAPSRVTTRA
jgi:subtilase family serine protease